MATMRSVLPNDVLWLLCVYGAWLLKKKKTRFAYFSWIWQWNDAVVRYYASFILPMTRFFSNSFIW